MVFNTKFKWGIYDGLYTLGIHNQWHYGQKQEKSFWFLSSCNFDSFLEKLHVSLKNQHEKESCICHYPY